VQIVACAGQEGRPTSKDERKNRGSNGMREPDGGEAQTFPKWQIPIAPRAPADALCEARG